MNCRKLVPPMLSLALLAMLMAGCGGGEDVDLTPVPPQGREMLSLEVTSTAFANGEPIPIKYTCDGEDLSPPLQWGEPPEGTQSFVLIADDPDAPGGTWVHWSVFNLPAETRALSEAVSPRGNLPAGALQGKNTWGDANYGGPCPPGGTHRYHFRLYALDTVLGLEAGARSKELLQAMEGHALAHGEVMGVYKSQ